MVRQGQPPSAAYPVSGQCFMGVFCFRKYTRKEITFHGGYKSFLDTPNCQLSLQKVKLIYIVDL